MDNMAIPNQIARSMDHPFNTDLRTGHHWTVDSSRERTPCMATGNPQKQSVDKGEKDDDLIDVVNVSLVHPGPLSTKTSTENGPKSPSPHQTNPEARFSTPVSEKYPSSAFAPICSPIPRSSTIVYPPLSPDSSGYRSGSSQSSVKSRSPSDFTREEWHGYKAINGSSTKSSTTQSRLSSPSVEVDSGYSDIRPSRNSPKCYSPEVPTQQTPKNSRTTYTSSQVRVLEKAFLKDQYPEPETIEELSKEINVAGNKIKVWFQNKRARARRFMSYAPNPQVSAGNIGLQNLSNHLPGIPHGYYPHIAAITPQAIPHMGGFSPLQMFYPGPFSQCYQGMHPAYITNPSGSRSTTSTLLTPDMNCLPMSFPAPFMLQPHSLPGLEIDQPSTTYLPPTAPVMYPAC